MTRSTILAAALAAALVAPATAGAATISYEGDTLVYAAAPGERNAVSLGDAMFDSQKLKFIDSVPIGIQSDRCTGENDWAECDLPARIVIELGDGDDHAAFSAWEKQIPVEVRGGDGNDLLEGYSIYGEHQGQLLDGGPGNDTIDGDQGADVVRGGPGDDTLEGGAGADVVEGGDGADQLLPDGFADPATDTVDGGPGFDTVADYVQPAKAFNPPVAISLDGAANDGRPGENDNLVGIEKVDSTVNGTFTGGPGPDDFFVRGAGGASTITGGGGNDKLVGHDHVETIDGGPGDDRVEGGFDGDTLTGGPGRDAIFGDSTADTCNFLACRIPYGNDVIDARDGEADTIDCGPGEDRLMADAIDVAANCEQAGPGPQPGPGPGSKPGLAVSAGKLRKALRTGLTVRVSGLAAGARVRVTVKRGRATVASGRGRAGADGRATVRARFTPKARRTLRRKPAVRLTVTAGAATATITLRRARSARAAA